MHPTVILELGIRSRKYEIASTAESIARALDHAFQDQDVVLEGEIRVTAIARNRGSGALLGKSEFEVLLPIDEEHRPSVDADTLETSPGDRHPDGVIG